MRFPDARERRNLDPDARGRRDAVPDARGRRDVVPDARGRKRDASAEVDASITRYCDGAESSNLKWRGVELLTRRVRLVELKY